MNRFKIIFGYILGIITSILLSLLAILIIFKFTVFKKEYVYSVLDKTNYYNEVYENALIEMKDYMTSSGLEEEILNDLFTIDEVKDDVNKYFDYYYKGKVYNKDLSLMKEKLSNNIDTYLKNNNIDVTNRNELNSFINDITDIYNKEIMLYNVPNKIINPFIKISNLINKLIVILSIIIIIFSLILIVFKTKYISSVIMSSGLIIFFIRFLILEKIDIKNIILITEYASKVIIKVLLNILELLLRCSIYMILIGLVICLIESIVNNKKRKKGVN